MHRATRILVLAAALCALPALAAESVPAAPAGVPDPQDYARFASEPVEHVQFASIHGWEPIDDQHVVLFTGVSKAWLLDLAGPCFELDHAFAISVTSFGNRIESKFDKVLAGKRSCRIVQIRKVDLAAFRAAKRQLSGELELGKPSSLLAAQAVERPKDEAAVAE